MQSVHGQISVDVVDTFTEKERMIRCKITLHRLKIIVPRVLLRLFLSFPARPPIFSSFYFQLSRT